MIDPYQVLSIKHQISKKNRIKYLKKVQSFLTSLIGMITAVAGIFVVDCIFNILEKKKLKDVFKVRAPWQVYYASVIAGGINGILVVYLPPKLYSASSVIIVTVIYETIAKMTNLNTLNNYELVRAIVRDLFLIYLVLYIIDLITGKNVILEQSGNDEDDFTVKGFDELFTITLVSAIIINICLVITRFGVNKLLNIDNGLNLEEE